MRWILKGLKWAALGLGALLGLAAVFGFVQWTRAKGSLPILEGTVNTTVASRATISRDANALVYIEADTEIDALFALGFAHAQDRLWQMDMVRRAARGRLSEHFGGITLGFDKYMRHWAFPALAKDSWEAFSAADKARVEAYAAGINAYLQSELYRKTPEHILLMREMEPWSPIDSLLVTKMLWSNLSTNLFQEVTREQLRLSLAPDLAQEFLRPYPDGGHVSMEWEDLARTLGLERAGRPSPESTIKISPGGENSNNWVVSGVRSVSGFPMLANDPHLGLTMPGFWHLVQMRIGDAVRSGGTIAGMPAIVIGHNEAVSWGTTNGQDTDVQDVYLEQLNPGASTEYETPNGWASFQIREETITVRFGQQVVQRYRQTERGPVMEPSAIPFPIPETEGGVYSLRWTALEGKDLTLSAIMAINRAQSAQDVRDSANLFAGPPQNIVYAHRDGDIGLVVAGKTPIRLDSHETKGAAPADGWRPENQWQGFIPDALMPHVANPKSGMLVTANAKVVPPQYPYFRSVEAADPSRQRRIDDLLKATTKHDLLSFAAIQTDTLAPVATALLPFMKAATPVDEDAALALTLLDGWNGDWSADSAAPVIFAQWASLLTQALIWDELGDLAPGYAWLSMRRLADVLGGPIDSWCDDRATADRVETCDTLLSETLSATAAALLAENAALDSLRWSDIQRDTHGHIGLAAIPLLGDVLSRETNRSAGPDSPNVSSLRVDTLPRSAGGGFGPSMRFIIDMAQPNEARFSISSGQSGHFASPHYDDLQTLWAAGDYVRFDEASARAGKKIVLLPAQ